MTRLRPHTLALALVIGLCPRAQARAAEASVDLAAYRPAAGIAIVHEQATLRVDWPLDNGESARIVLDLTAGRPLFRSIEIATKGQPLHPILENADPVTFLLVGSREAPRDRPPTMSVFNTFFDSPASRPCRAFRSELTPNYVRVSSIGNRAHIAITNLSLGSFQGEFQLKIYARSPLLHLESIVHTTEHRRAILYDTGLACSPSNSTHPSFSWLDTENRWNQADSQPTDTDRQREVGWQPLLDALRAGHFFVSTGEVLIPRFEVNSLGSGSNVSIEPDGHLAIQVNLSWTFPLHVVEIISGNRHQVERQRVGMSHVSAFDEQSLQLALRARKKKWLRVEAWDVASNGAFTQPVGLVNPSAKSNPLPADQSPSNRRGA